MLTSPNVHRRSRRTLTSGSQVPRSPIPVTATPSGSTVSLSFASPVVVNAPAPLVVESRTFVSQNYVTPTLLVVTLSGTAAGMDYSLAGNVTQIRGFQGEGTAPVAGTFP